MKLNDLTGRTFGMLTVLKHTGSNAHNKALWRCRCECGIECEKIGSMLLNGHTMSCGCYKRSAVWKITHGQKRQDGATPVYKCWQNMLARCRNPHVAGFKNYGGRGIKVCKRWEKFENFYADMGDPPPGGTLDRTNNEKGYSKANCEWKDRKHQRRNSRNHMVWLTIDGDRMILRDAVAKLRIVSYAAAVNRIHRGWTPKDAVMTPYLRIDNKGYR